MDWEWVRRLWESSWHVALVFVGCIIYLVFGFAMRGGPPAAEVDVAPAAQVSGDDLSQAELKRILEEGRDRPAAPPPLTEAEIAQADIDSYLKQFEEDPQSPDAPAYLFASANLYATAVGNDEQACRLYERILLEYPAWERVNSVYPLLCSAYERAGERREQQDLLYKMLQLFPEDTPLHLYATEQLGRMPIVEVHPEADTPAEQ